MHEELEVRLKVYLQTKPITPFNSNKLTSTASDISSGSSMVSPSSMNTTVETLNTSALDDVKPDPASCKEYGVYVPTQRHFFSEVKTSFTCVHCGYSRDPLIVSEGGVLNQYP